MLSTLNRGRVLEQLFMGTVRQWLPKGPVLAQTSRKMAVMVPSFLPPIFTRQRMGWRVELAMNSSSRVLR